jgi:hypothetical protein
MARSMGRTDGHVITNGIVIVNIMFGVCIADCPRVPVRFQGFRICSSCMDCSRRRFRFHADLLCAMNPEAGASEEVGLE